MGEIDANGENDSKPAKAGKVIAFSAAKDELCTLSSGFKMLARRLRTTLKPVTIKEELTRECIGDAAVRALFGCCVFSTASFALFGTRARKEGRSASADRAFQCQQRCKVLSCTCRR